jgi:hypothetical protein
VRWYTALCSSGFLSGQPRCYQITQGHPNKVKNVTLLLFTASQNLLFSAGGGGYQPLGKTVRKEFYLSLERAGENSYVLNLTLAAVVLLGLNAGLFFRYHWLEVPHYGLGDAMNVIVLSNLGAAIVMSLLALRHFPKIGKNIRDNLLLGLSYTYLVGFVTKHGHEMFGSLLTCQLWAMGLLLLTMLVIPLAVVVSGEGEITISLVQTSAE